MYSSTWNASLDKMIGLPWPAQSIQRSKVTRTKNSQELTWKRWDDSNMINTKLQTQCIRIGLSGRLRFSCNVMGWSINFMALISWDEIIRLKNITLTNSVVLSSTCTWNLIRMCKMRCKCWQHNQLMESWLLVWVIIGPTIRHERTAVIKRKGEMSDWVGWKKWELTSHYLRLTKRLYCSANHFTVVLGSG